MAEQTWPRPRCVTCAAQAPCEARGTTLPSYPQCHVPLRRTDPRRLAALFEAWRAHDGADDVRLRALEAALLARVAEDGQRFSEVLEPSFGWTRDEGHRLYRFSYAFPGFRGDPEGTTRAVVGLAGTFGDAAAHVGERVMRAARHPSVVQPLFGLACDAGAIRLKLYLQFADDAGAAALTLASRMVGVPDLAARLGAAAGAPLHLACVDFSPSGGVVGAKLYLAYPKVDLRAPSPVPSGALFDALAASGVASLSNVLAIHHLAGPADAGVAVPREIDFGLVENDLLFRDVKRLAPLAPIVLLGTPSSRIESAFRVGVRRLTVSTGEVTKLNVYYVLAETEAVVPT